jgi:predicted Zn-dependent protease
MTWYDVATFVAKHPDFNERIVIAQAWAQVIAGIDKKFDRDAFLSACDVKYEKPPMEER